MSGAIDDLVCQRALPTPTPLLVVTLSCTHASLSLFFPHPSVLCLHCVRVRRHGYRLDDIPPPACPCQDYPAPVLLEMNRTRSL
ncbi:unnamed protein product [Periconia digitata]|uniref:Uncharacterized protein n=1 Tax=Periconia digitata TaxID=1303443 RepID=A0A9W4UI13_9PLEO|nr:unnamed protein product [Periconia digitata]